MSLKKLSFLSLHTEIIQLIAVALEDELARATFALTNAELRSILLPSCQPHVAVYAAIISLDSKLCLLAINIFGRKVVPRAVRYAANLEHPAWSPPGVLEPVYAMSKLVYNKRTNLFMLIHQIYSTQVGTPEDNVGKWFSASGGSEQNDPDSAEDSINAFDPEAFHENCYRWMFDALKAAIDTNNLRVIDGLRDKLGGKMSLDLIEYCLEKRKINWATYLIEHAHQALNRFTSMGWASAVYCTIHSPYLAESILSSDEKMFALIYKYHMHDESMEPTMVRTEENTTIPAIMWLAQWGLANHFSHPGTLGIWQSLVYELWGLRNPILRDYDGKSVLHHLAENGSTAYGRKRIADDPCDLSITETYRRMLRSIGFPFLAEVIDAKDNNGHTPLHLAVANEEYIMVDWLVANGADCNALDGDGLMPWDPESYKNERCKWIAREVYEVGLRQLDFPLVQYNKLTRALTALNWRMFALDSEVEWMSKLEADNESVAFDGDSEPECVSEMDWYPDTDVNWASDSEKGDA